MPEIIITNDKEIHWCVINTSINSATLNASFNIMVLDSNFKQMTQIQTTNPYVKTLWLLASFLLVGGIPLLATYIKYDYAFPAGYFNYPALTPEDKPAFNLLYFCIILALVLFTSSLYLIPKVFGFQFAKLSVSKPAATKLPWWFWAGIPLAIEFQVLAWGKFSEPAFFVRYAYVPIFAAYGLILDGIVYKRTGGKSFLANYGTVFFAVIFVSGVNWAIFGYLNFFLGANWYYPDGDAISKTAFTLYAFAGSMTLAPMVFIAYHLLKSFPALPHRYISGPKIVFPLWAKYLSLAIMSAGMFVVPFWPNELFPFLWVGPTFIFAAVLGICNVWTPLTPIKQGNWAPLAMIALAGFVQGFLWEGMNYFSASHDPFHTNIPGYWIYSIPYVELGHIFEMPALGFFGYLPYGLFCWIFWLVCAELFHIPPSISDDN